MIRAKQQGHAPAVEMSANPNGVPASTNSTALRRHIGAVDRKTRNSFVFALLLLIVEVPDKNSTSKASQMLAGSDRAKVSSGSLSLIHVRKVSELPRLRVTSSRCLRSSILTQPPETVESRSKVEPVAALKSRIEVEEAR